MNISKFTLGTTQLGKHYGIANKSGKPKLLDANKILDVAIKQKINTFDTSPVYGNSEKILGDFFKKIPDFAPNIITKIPKIELDESVSSDKIFNQIKKSIDCSKNNLKVDFIPICLLHDPSDMLSFNGNVVESLIKLKNEGHIGKIGVSVYTPDDVKKFLKIKNFEVIQLPLNIFDLRLLKNGLLRKLFEEKKMIFARSVFLQGLFFLHPDKLPKKISMAQKPLQELHKISAEVGISVSSLAMGFVRSFEEITSMVIGVDSVEQLKNNIDLMDAPILSDQIKHRVFNISDNMPEKIINPALWDR